ncbi:ABC transporter permease subunit [Ramlibacter rhizophilus]|uniref:Polar amino acid ABC transporter permease n=1 Tax=Ramlibacter rhizophilus TaxID=1781167 RepID=A0A4Z0BXL5_9BURK|nr:ABC transporter permease subunit [Ramlibacter rhizophilus]TFZ03254.1 polar amino acid ABC transporter permease [Ramlibacter rhizophilus]
MKELAALATWTPFLLEGLAWNVLIASVAMLLGTLGGASLAWARLSPARSLRRASEAATALSRNVPTLVFQFYLALMLPGDSWPAWLKASLALALAVVGFTSDNLLVALRAWREDRRAVALLFVPSWGSYLLVVVIASSTASIIGVGELVSRANTVIAASDDPGIMVPVYLYASLVFLLFCWAASGMLGWLRGALARRYLA